MNKRTQFSRYSHILSPCLQKSFYAKVGRSTKKKKSKKTPEDIVAKHSAVLGLCSFVNAFPYDVPEFIPNVLMVLSDHLHDPQPIPVRYYSLRILNRAK